MLQAESIPTEGIETDELTSHQPNSTQSNRYIFGEVIARERLGVVHTAQDRRLERTVALKIMSDAYLHRSELRQRFENEARIVASLPHAGVIPVYDSGHLLDGRPFIAAKLIEGIRLHERFKSSALIPSELDPFLSIFERLCSLVAFLHTHQVVHRDLKPHNLLIEPSGNVLLTDWANATRIVSPQNPVGWRRAGLLSTLAAPFSGRANPAEMVAWEEYDLSETLAYESPEQARGDWERVGVKGDVFALGAILCKILTGDPPYIGTPEKLREYACSGNLIEAHRRLDASGADQGMVRLAKMCLAANPADRPEDAGIVAGIFEQSLASHRARTRSALLARSANKSQSVESTSRKKAVQKIRRTSLLLALVGASSALALAVWLFIDTRERWSLKQTEAQRIQSVSGQVEDALRSATNSETELQNATIQPIDRLWTIQSALESARRAEALIAVNRLALPDERKRIDELLPRLEEMGRDARFIAALTEWRQEPFYLNASRFEQSRAAKKCREMFQSRGFGLSAKIDDTANAIKKHEQAEPIRQVLTEWYILSSDTTERRVIVDLLKKCGSKSDLIDWLEAYGSPQRERLAQLVNLNLSQYTLSPLTTIASIRRLDLDQPALAVRIALEGLVKFPKEIVLQEELVRLQRESRDPKTLEIFQAHATAKHGEMLASLGELQSRFGQFRQAASTLREAAATFPEKSSRNEQLLGAARMATRWAGMEGRVDDVIAGNFQPSTAEAWADLAEVCQRTGRWVSAAKLLTEAVKLNNSFGPAAARAAGMAGLGVGSEAAKLSGDQRSTWRGEALKLLRQFPEASRYDAATAALPDPTILDSLTPTERSRWLAEWGEPTDR